MLEVVSLEEAKDLVINELPTIIAVEDTVDLAHAAGRVIAHDVVAHEGMPPFDRSTVDGYAVVASDTFGCSDSLPALLELAGEVNMGVAPEIICTPSACVRIPTGGQVPVGADAVVMLEYCEDYGDGTIGVAKPVAPGDNIVFENDDVKPGEVLIPAGTRLLPHHVGTLASLGMALVNVHARPCVGIISTGDEIVPVETTPIEAEMRDVNAPVIAAATEALGGEAVRFPIVPDNYDALRDTVEEALATCDIVLVSGGSSAGERDNTARVLGDLGELLFHGVAVKPGKPTMCAAVRGIPVFGLPGHPVAAYFMFLELVAPLLDTSVEKCKSLRTEEAQLVEGVPSNHGRTEFVAVKLENGLAMPVRGKSGLISQLADADGYITVPRNVEGFAAGATVDVKLFG